MPTIKRGFASIKRTMRDEESYMSCQIDKMLRKLEANPRARYEDVLTEEEYQLARMLMRAAVNHVQGYITRQRMKKFMLPKCFVFYGRRYRLKHSNLGRVFVTTKGGVDVLGSGFFEI